MYRSQPRPSPSEYMGCKVHLLHSEIDNDDIPTTLSVVATAPAATSEAPPVQMADPSTKAAPAMSSQIEFF